MKSKILSIFVLMLLISLVGAFGQQEFGLDDDPTTTAVGPPLPIIPPPFYSSAEDPFGVMNPAWMAGLIGPSPSLLPFGLFSSDVLFPGLAISARFMPPPLVYYVDSFSANHQALPFPAGQAVLRFSIDRATGGVAGTASQVQAAANDQPSDIYQSTSVFQDPASFLPLPPGPPVYAGALGGVTPPLGNSLYLDQVFFGPLASGGPYFAGSHDNIDSYNEFGGPLNVNPMYFTLSPAEALVLQMFPVSPADIFLTAAPPVLVLPPYAPAPTMGLDSMGFGTDSIDALIVWDNMNPGILDPGMDYALFSLSPNSATLGMLGLNPADVFLTDFQGSFALYATSNDLGLVTTIGGPGGGVPNVDALEIAEPGVIVGENPDVPFEFPPEDWANDCHVFGTITSPGGQPTFADVFVFGDPGTGNWQVDNSTITYDQGNDWTYNLDFSTDGTINGSPGPLYEQIHFGVLFFVPTEEGVSMNMFAFWTQDGVQSSDPFEIPCPQWGGGGDKAGGGGQTIIVGVGAAEGDKGGESTALFSALEIAISKDRIPLPHMISAALGDPGEPSPLYPHLEWEVVVSEPTPATEIAVNANALPGEVILIRGAYAADEKSVGSKFWIQQEISE